MGRFAGVTFESIKQIAETQAKEIERRRVNLWLHRFLYYKHDTSIISDYEYDKKELEYKILRKQYPNIKINGTCPLECVGTDCDRITESKINGLITDWMIHDKDGAKNAPQIAVYVEPKTNKKGNLLLFGTDFIACG